MSKSEKLSALTRIVSHFERKGCSKRWQDSVSKIWHHRLGCDVAFSIASRADRLYGEIAKS